MTLRNRAFRHVGGVVVVCGLVAACSQPAPQPTTPSPSPRPSSVSTTPAETQLERQQRLDFQAAEKSYRAFRKEYTRLAVSGGSKQVTPVMSLNAAGPYLKVMEYFLTETLREGVHQRGVVTIAYVNHGAYSPQRLTLNVCEDGRKVENWRKGNRVSNGVAAKLSLYARKIDGRWKIWDGDDQRVTHCGE